MDKTRSLKRREKFQDRITERVGFEEGDIEKFCSIQNEKSTLSFSICCEPQMAMISG